MGGLLDALKAIASLLVAINFKIFGDPINEFLLSAIFFKQKKEVSDHRYEKGAETQLKKLGSRKPFRIANHICMCLKSKKDRRMVDAGLNMIDR